MFFKNPILSESEYARLQSNAQEPVPRYAAGTGTVKASAAWLIDESKRRLVSGWFRTRCSSDLTKSFDKES